MQAELTAREQQVVEVLATTGGTDRQIAEALHLSPKTVKFHLTSARGKLGARNRTHLAVLVLGGGA